MRFKFGKSTSYSTSRVRPNTKKAAEERRSRSSSATILIGAVVIALLAAGFYLKSDTPETAPASRYVAAVETAPPPAAIKTTPPPPLQAEPPAESDNPWDGPIIYHSPQNAPIHLVLVEKAVQKLHLYRYDGSYERIKTYGCGTGERKGRKRVENDEKTPEGIYFNTKIYRDRNVTVFGDRAFELNYPNPFDNIAGNGGHGIYIHGSNRKVTPYSTNGCVALDNLDLKDLDKRIEFDKTPVIIGERLPYTFSKPKLQPAKLVALFRQAMVPKKYARKKIDFPGITILRYQDKLVSFGTLRIKADTTINAISRLYLDKPAAGLMVMVKREWKEKQPAATIAKKTPAPTVSKEKDVIATLVKTWKNAWERKRLDAYIAHYHPGFIGNGKTLAEWKRYKKRLNGKYKKFPLLFRTLKPKSQAIRPGPGSNRTIGRTHSSQMATRCWNLKKRGPVEDFQGNISLIQTKKLAILKPFSAFIP